VGYQPAAVSVPRAHAALGALACSSLA
jgi:hypothetical protein